MKPDIKNVKAILFDMDGVIIDSMKHHAKCWVHIFKQKGINIRQSEIYKREGIKPARLIHEIYQINGLQISNESMQNVLDEKISHYWNNYNPLPFKEIYTVLEKLKEKYKLAIVSGSTKYNVNRVLNDFQLAKYFNAVVNSDMVTKGKPHPMSFIKAYEMLKLSPGECVCIENAPYGIKSAKGAGVYTCAITTTLNEKTLYNAGADYVVNSHQEILRLLGVEV